MAANVLASPRAIEMSVHVVRAYVRLREMIGTNKELARKLVLSWTLGCWPIAVSN